MRVVRVLDHWLVASELGGSHLSFDSLALFLLEVSDLLLKLSLLVVLSLCQPEEKQADKDDKSNCDFEHFDFK